MAEKKGGLGRGIGALIPEVANSQDQIGRASCRERV